VVNELNISGVILTNRQRRILDSIFVVRIVLVIRVVL